MTLIINNMHQSVKKLCLKEVHNIQNDLNEPQSNHLPTLSQLLLDDRLHELDGTVPLGFFLHVCVAQGTMLDEPLR